MTEEQRRRQRFLYLDGDGVGRDEGGSRLCGGDGGSREDRW